MRRLVSIAALLLSASLAAEVVRIPTTDPDTIARLQRDHDFWGLDRRSGHAIFHVSAEQRDALVAAGHDVETDPVRDAELRKWRDRKVAAAGEGTLAGFDCYRTVERSYADLSDLASAHPGAAEWIEIGETWQAGAGGAAGGPVRALRIGRSSTPQPALVVTGAQHARELATAEIATRFAELILTNPTNDPDIDWLLDHREIHVVPQHNPDGRRRVEAGDSLWRKNHNETACPSGNASTTWVGTDLNRNGSFLWSASSNACSPVYAGAALASEPETVALENYLAQVFDDRRPVNDLTTPAPDDTEGIFISLHSFGEYVLIPWEGLGGQNENNAPNHDALTLLGRRFGSLTDYAVARWQLLPPATGTAVDYAYGEFGVAAYTFEVGTTFFQSCESFESTVWPANRDALLMAARSARAPYRTPSGPVLDALSWALAPGKVTIEGTADDDRYFSGGVTEPPQPNPVDEIVRIRVSIGAPESVTGEALLFDLPAPAPALDFSVDLPIDAVVDGTNRIFVVGQDASGHVGAPRVIVVDELIHGNGFEAGSE